MIDKFEGEYRWLSNFYPCDVTFEDKVYPSVEHAYQAAKYLDPKIREAIRIAYSAKAAKRMGKAKGLRADWEDVRLGIMEDLVRQKFQLPAMYMRLLDTKNQELVEGNWWGDTFWGVCKGEGENHLGKILMKIRSELRQS